MKDFPGPEQLFTLWSSVFCFVMQSTWETADMDDRELVQELRARAGNLVGPDGVSHFLAYEYEILVRAADRLDYLSTKLEVSDLN